MGLTFLLLQGFHNVRSVSEVVLAWKSQRTYAPGSGADAAVTVSILSESEDVGSKEFSESTTLQYHFPAGDLA